MQSAEPLTETELRALMDPKEEEIEPNFQHRKLKKSQEKPAVSQLSLHQRNCTSQEALEPTDPDIKREERAILGFGLNLPTDGPENDANYNQVLKVLNFFESLGPRGQKRAQQIRDKLKEDFYSSI